MPENYTPAFLINNSNAYYKIVKLIEQYPNDQELGRMIRKFIDENNTIKSKIIELDESDNKQN